MFVVERQEHVKVWESRMKRKEQLKERTTERMNNLKNEKI